MLNTCVYILLQILKNDTKTPRNFICSYYKLHLSLYKWIKQWIRRVRSNSYCVIIVQKVKTHWLAWGQEEQNECPNLFPVLFILFFFLWNSQIISNLMGITIRYRVLLLVRAFKWKWFDLSSTKQHEK